MKAEEKLMKNLNAASRDHERDYNRMKGLRNRAVIDRKKFEMRKVAGREVLVIHRGNGKIYSALKCRYPQVENMTIKDLQTEINDLESKIAFENFICGQVSSSENRRLSELYKIANDRKLFKRFYDQVILVPAEEVEMNGPWSYVKSEILSDLKRNKEYK